jgi:hypothetical protein
MGDFNKYGPHVLTSGVILFSIVLISCSSNPESPPQGMEPVSQTTSPLQSSAVPAVPEESQALVRLQQDPSLVRLRDLITSMGYEGIGLEFESAEMIEFLSKVFSDKRMAGRDFSLVYTGVGLAYDANAKSLTIGGTRDIQSVVSFVVKKIPMRVRSK